MSALGRKQTLANVRYGPIGDSVPQIGTVVDDKRYSEMDESARKLRSLARQSRALALMMADKERAKSLESLARLYERQAAELEPA